MKYIEIDTHKDILTASVISTKGKVIRTIDVHATHTGPERIHNKMEGEEYCMMMESSTYAYRTY